MRRQRIALFGLLSLGAPALAALGLTACLYNNDAHDEPGDKPADAGPPSALGNGARIHDLIPAGTEHPAEDASVYITGASLVAVDTFDETGDGKSIGTVYVQDVGPAPVAPYSGIELYRPTYSPANLLLAPGDVIDLTGAYQDYAYTSFPKGYSIPEIDEPIVTFRFEYTVPTPTVVTASDFQSPTTAAIFQNGYRWQSMLVEIDDVTITAASSSSGRVSLFFTGDTSEDGPVIANELYDLRLGDYAVGTHFSKIIGVCTYFFNFQIAPRSPADLVIAPQ